MTLLSALRQLSPGRLWPVLVLLVSCMLVATQEAAAAAAEDIRIVHRILAEGAEFDPRDRESLLPMGNSVSLGYTTDELWVGFESSVPAAHPDDAPLTVAFSPGYTKQIDIHLLDRAENRLVLLASCGSRSRDRSACAAGGLPGTWAIEPGRIEDLFIRFAGTNTLAVFVEVRSRARIPWSMIATTVAVGALAAVGLWSLLLLIGGFSWLPFLFVIVVFLQALHAAHTVGLTYPMFPHVALAAAFDVNILALTAAVAAMHYAAVFTFAHPGLPLRVAATVSSLLVAAAALVYIAGHERAALMINMTHVSCLPIIFLALVLVSMRRSAAPDRDLTIRRLYLFYLVLLALTILPPAMSALGAGNRMPWHLSWNMLFVLSFFGFVVQRHLFEAVRAHEKAEGELRLAVEKAETSERLGRVFTLATIGGVATHISHEMRTPLATLLMSLKNLRASLPLDHETHRDAVRNLDRMERAVSRMRSVTDGVSALIRTPQITGKSSLNRAVADSLALLEPRLRAEEIRLTQNVPGEEVFVHADKFDVETAVLNIIVNACDAAGAREAGQRFVEVAVVPDADVASVVVMDSGGGVPEDDLNRIFEMMFTTKPDGTGLGLPLVRQMTERWGGSIQIANRDAGACAVLTFPLVQAGAEADGGPPPEQGRPASHAVPAGNG